MQSWRLEEEQRAARGSERVREKKMLMLVLIVIVIVFILLVSMLMTLIIMMMSFLLSQYRSAGRRSAGWQKPSARAGAATPRRCPPWRAARRSL